nr:HNH endonuclease [Actinobaculum suis]
MSRRGRSWGGGTKIRKLTELVIAHYGLECSVCHEMIDLRYRSPSPKSFSIDHVLPRALGGSDDIANLRPAHRGCNSAKGKRILQPARRRYLNRQFF